VAKPSPYSTTGIAPTGMLCLEQLNNFGIDRVAPK